MRFSPPPANTYGGYTLIWLIFDFIFIVPHLPKTLEEEYKVYPLTLPLCVSHNRAILRIFINTLVKHKRNKSKFRLAHLLFIAEPESQKVFIAIHFLIL